MTTPHPKFVRDLIGSRVTFTSSLGQERTGTVLDRGPNGVGQDGYEAAGYWLWVQTDDEDAGDVQGCALVRTWGSGKRAGTFAQHTGRVWLRSGLRYVGYSERLGVPLEDLPELVLA